MKLIIDIPDKDYEFIKDLRYVVLARGNTKTIQKHIIDAIKQGEIYEGNQGEWNTHQVACILAELFGDTCACNYCGIDEWLPKKCDFANKECPDVVGVACWEQFLKHRANMKDVRNE